MRKVSRVFLTLGTVFGFIGGILVIILGAVCAAVGKIKLEGELLEAVQNIIKDTFNGDVAKFQEAAFALGIVFIIVGLLSIASGVFCIIAKAKPKTGNLITAIVLTACGGSAFGLLGAIFGLVANAGEKNNQPANPQY